MAEQEALISETVMEMVQAKGREIGAKLAYFMDDKFMQYYKPGDLSSNHYWLYMPILKNRPDEWRNSFHFCLERMLDFERNRGKKVALVPIEYPAPESGNN